MKSTIFKIWIALASIGCLTPSSMAQQFYGQAPVYAPYAAPQYAQPPKAIYSQGQLPYGNMAYRAADGVPEPIAQSVPEPTQTNPGGCDTPGCDDPGCCDWGSGCDSCGDGACGGCCGSGFLGLGNGLGSFLNGGSDLGVCRPSRVWGGAEYLNWWNKARNIPALITTSPANGILPGATILFGNEEIGGDDHSGYRYTGGLWLDAQQIVGIGGRYFELDVEDRSFLQSSDGSVVLARPFFNADPGVNAQDALLVAAAGVSTGSVYSDVETDVRGYDVYLRYLLYTGYCNRIDFIGGYHHTDIDDTITVGHDLVSVDGTTHGPVGTAVSSVDNFVVDNDFDGGEIGFLSEANDGRLTWTLMSKISFGNMRQRVTHSGSTTTTSPPPPPQFSATQNYGLLNLGTINGTQERDEFTIVPELALNVAYNLTSQLSVSVGYSLIYWDDVLLANQVIDTTTNPTQNPGPIVGPNRPAFDITTVDSSSYWVQGINFGVHGRY